MSDNKTIINYLQQLIDEQDMFIEKSLEDYPEYEGRDTFCHECGYDTNDINYHEEYIKNYLLDKLKNLTESEV